MFFKKKQTQCVNETSIEKEKNLVDKEVYLYKREKMLEVDRSIVTKDAEAFLNLHTFRKELIDKRITDQNTFVENSESMKVEIAKLDAELGFKAGLIAEVKEFVKVRAERDAYKAEAEASKKICESKDKTIELLDGIVKVVVGKLSKVDVGSLAVHVAPTKESK